MLSSPPSSIFRLDLDHSRSGDRERSPGFRKQGQETRDKLCRDDNLESLCRGSWSTPAIGTRRNDEKGSRHGGTESDYASEKRSDFVN